MLGNHGLPVRAFVGADKIQRVECGKTWPKLSRRLKIPVLVPPEKCPSVGGAISRIIETECGVSRLGAYLEHECRRQPIGKQGCQRFLLLNVDKAPPRRNWEVYRLCHRGVLNDNHTNFHGTAAPAI